jgi:peptide/nickel transport system permease protein
MILSYFASRRRQRQAAIPALAHIPLSLAPGVATAAP